MFVSASAVVVAAVVVAVAAVVVFVVRLRGLSAVGWRGAEPSAW